MSDLLERVYLRSPIWAQQVAVTAYGLWWYRRRFSGHFHKLVGEYKARENWTEEQFHEYQTARLAEVFDAACKSPYYRDVFLQSGVTADMPPFDALSRLPFLCKETLRTRAKDLLTGDPPSGTIVQETSGTTGTPVEIYYTPEFHALEMAVPEVRTLNWAGVTYRDRRVMFGMRRVCAFGQSRPPFWRYSLVENMAYVSTYHLASRFLPAYMAFLRTYRPSVIMGYPSVLYPLARYALETGDMPAPARVVVTTSEAVTERARRAIEATWQCRLFDRYGAVEGCVFASQCEHGKYHVSPEVGIVEIVDRDGQPCPPGVLGQVVCTGLQNRLQPLIRYRIGDVARWATEQTCRCGRHLPILESIGGRYEDICYTRDGREVFALEPAINGVTAIREAQLVQETLDSFLIYVVPAAGFCERDIARIKDNMRLVVGDTEVLVEPVSTIPRSASGKFRAEICRLSAEERASLVKVGH